LREKDLTLCHQFYADNTTMMLEAEVGSANGCQKFVEEVGRASGLKVRWEDTAAVLIGADTVPAEPSQFQLKWEAPGDTSKLLGYYFNAGISHDMVLQEIKSKLADQIKLAKSMPFPSMKQITGPKSLFMGKLWYVLALWKGEDKELKEIEREMVKFLWAGMKFKALPTVLLTNLYKEFKEGGIGLRSIREQVKCMAGNIIIWMVAGRDHPLQKILQNRIQTL
jgi:hypothetical protein